MHHRCTKCFLFSHKSVSLFISSSHSRAVFRERRFPYTPIEYLKKVTIRTSTEQVLIARILKLHFMSAHTETILCLLFFGNKSSFGSYELQPSSFQPRTCQWSINKAIWRLFSEALELGNIHDGCHTLPLQYKWRVSHFGKGSEGKRIVVESKYFVSSRKY